MLAVVAQSIQRRYLYLVSLLLVIVGPLLVYAQVRTFDYVWDDLYLFVYSSALRGESLRLGRLFEPIVPFTTYFRPAVMGSFVLEFMVGGVDAGQSHLINLGLFTANVLMVYTLTFRLSVRREPQARVTAGLAAALIYLVSPVQIESVAWVAGRFDVMCTFFVLLALNCAVWIQRAWLANLLVGVSFALALCSKEMAITLPFLLLLVTWAARPPQERGTLQRHFVAQWRNARTRWTYLSIGLALAGYLALRVIAMHRFIHVDHTVSDGLNVLKWLSLVGHTTAFYIRQMVFPFAEIGPMHPFNIGAISLTGQMLGILALGVALAVATVAVWRHATWAIWLTIVLVALAPVLNLIPLTIAGSIGQERFLSLPFAFFCVGLAISWQDYLLRPGAPRRYHIYTLALGVLWSTAALVNVHVTLPLWQQDLLLWKWAHERDPSSKQVRNIYLNAAIRSGQFRLYEEAAPNPPETPDEALLYGYYLLRTNRPAEALHVLLDRIQERKYGPIGASLFQPYIQISFLSEAYIAVRDFENGLGAAKATLDFAPDYPPAYLLKSLALYGLKRNAEADEAFKIASQHLGTVGGEDAVRIRNQLLKQLSGGAPSQSTLQ